MKRKPMKPVKAWCPVVDTQGKQEAWPMWIHMVKSDCQADMRDNAAGFKYRIARVRITEVK